MPHSRNAFSLRQTLFSIRARFLVVLLFFVALVATIMGHLAADLGAAHFSGWQGGLLVAVVVLSALFMGFLYKDVFLPLWRITQQLVTVARDPERVGEFVNGFLSDNDVGVAQAALNELFFRVEHSTRKLRSTNVDAGRRLAAIEALHDGIAMVDARGALIYTNAAFGRLHDCRRQDTGLACRRWAECYDGGAAAFLENSSIPIMQQDGYWHGEVECDVSGKKLLLEVSLTMLDDGGFIAIERDISARRQMEQEKESLHNLFVQAQKMEAVGRLTGGVAHDFNNMLAIIQGNLELMEDFLPDEIQARKFMASAQRAVQRGGELTQRLLSFSRRQVLSPRVVALGGFITDALTLLLRATNEKIECTQSIDADTWPIKVDSGQLENALLNLVINARDAMPGGGVITISAANVMVDVRRAAMYEVPPGEYVCLGVADTGQGMDRDVLARVFEPFFTTKGVGKGTGLGLSMVYGFVKQSGGFVDVDSAPGAGTRVMLYFPRHVAQVESADVHAQGARLVQQAFAGVAVIAEDDADVMEITKQRLERYGYSVHTAGNGHEALEIFRKLPKADLLLADIEMPGGMDGVALALQAREVFPKLKVLLLSGHAQTEDVLKPFMAAGVVSGDGSLASGARYLSKPYTQQRLAEEIEALVAQA